VRAGARGRAQLPDSAGSMPAGRYAKLPLLVGNFAQRKPASRARCQGVVLSAAPALTRAPTGPTSSVHRPPVLFRGNTDAGVRPRRACTAPLTQLSSAKWGWRWAHVFVSGNQLTSLHTRQLHEQRCGRPPPSLAAQQTLCAAGATVQRPRHAALNTHPHPPHHTHTHTHT
jgi:hypothetical protein